MRLQQQEGHFQRQPWVFPESRLYLLWEPPEIAVPAQIRYPSTPGCSSAGPLASDFPDTIITQTPKRILRVLSSARRPESAQQACQVLFNIVETNSILSLKQLPDRIQHKQRLVGSPNTATRPHGQPAERINDFFSRHGLPRPVKLRASPSILPHACAISAATAR